MFKKIIQSTDWHVGKKNNSDVHNDDCIEFAKWLIAQGKEHNAETCVITGDFHDVRAAINIKTLDYSIKILEMLSEAFEKVYIIPGNHDLYHRQRRDIHSLKFAKHIKNVIVVDNPTTIDNVCFLPWLIDDEYKTLADIKADYVFAHLEMPKFFMNSMIAMPDLGKANAEMFKGPKYVFTGHFHKRQIYENANGTQVIYTGNCFPHDYSDVGDVDRGCMILENGGSPAFINWPDCPTYNVAILSKLLEEPEVLLKQKSYLRVDNDLDLKYDEISFIRESLMKTFNTREIVILPKRLEINDSFSSDITQFKTVDSMIINHLSQLESTNFEKNLLTTIYTTI